MRFPNLLPKDMQGFTLIEVIITIVVFALASSLFVNYFSSYISQSTTPVIRLNHAAQLQQAAQNITQAYLIDQTADLNVLRTALNNTPEAFGQNFNVQYNNFIKFIGNDDGPISSGDEENLLKVKIKHNITGETTVMLFTKQ